MTTSAIRFDSTAVEVAVGADALSVTLADGRVLSMPLAWFPRLADATTAQRGNWRFIDRGQGIHCPDVDEDVSVETLLRLH